MLYVNEVVLLRRRALQLQEAFKVAKPAPASTSRTPAKCSENFRYAELFKECYDERSKYIEH